MESSYEPTLAEFRAMAHMGNVVPVCRRVMADTLTPVLAYQKAAAGTYGFLLESAAGPEAISRYSFLGADPFALFRCTGNEIRLWEDGHDRSWTTDDPLDDFGRYLEQFRFVPVAGLPRLSCGAVGYMGYDVVRYVEHLPDCPADDRQLPDMFFMFFDQILIFDHWNKTVNVVVSARLDGRDPDEAYGEAVHKIDRLVAELRRPVRSKVADVLPPPQGEPEFESNFARDDYLAAVEKARQYIRAGDIFQVVPSQRLAVRTTARPLDIYRTLRVINPSPYMFLLRFDDLHVIGASPEVMVQVENRRVTVRPIAGTVRRGANDAEDERLAAELLADPKERAEHIMLVDLGRNDVGRVSKYGTVHLEDVMVIEKYSHVMHIVSSVTGELQDDLTALDALKACLPAGTLSGAPKVRAMQIIDELEPTKRGPYGGAVGYFDFSGNMDTCIAIRTIVLDGRRAYVQAGGGIVADSVPEREFEETLNKARAALRAVQAAEAMPD